MEREAEFYAAKQKLLQQMNVSRAKAEGEDLPLATPILEMSDNPIESNSLYLDSDGKWARRVDAMLWQVAPPDDESEIAKVLLTVGELFDPESPYANDHDALAILEEDYLAQEGEGLLAILLGHLARVTQEYEDGLR